MPPRIRTQAHINEGVAALCAICPDMSRTVAELECPVPTRLRKGGYETLLHAIVGQQVSVASASAIWARLTAAINPLEPEVLLRKRNVTLQKIGLSRPKVRYVRALSQAIVDGKLDLGMLPRLSDEDAIAQLTHVPGVGLWTAEIYLMFCLGRWDVFPSADVAIQNQWAAIARLKERPTASQMAGIAERWSPYRSIAARVLWTHLRQTRMMAGSKNSEGLPV